MSSETGDGVRGVLTDALGLRRQRNEKDNGSLASLSGLPPEGVLMKKFVAGTAIAMALAFGITDARAVDYSTFALVELVEGITINETAALNFGVLAETDGNVTIATSLTVGPPPLADDPDYLTFEGANQTRAEFTVTSVAGATVQVNVTPGATVDGLTLTNPTIDIDGSGEISALPHDAVLSAASVDLYVGATLQVDTSFPTVVAAGQQVPYIVSVVFN